MSFLATYESLTRLDEVKDCCTSKKHQSRKATHLEAATPAPRQTTIKTILASKDHRDEFAIDFVKMRTDCDIPLEGTQNEIIDCETL